MRGVALRIVRPSRCCVASGGGRYLCRCKGCVKCVRCFVWYIGSMISKKIVIYIVLLVVVLLVAIWGLWLLDQQAAPKREAYADLAQCLSDKGVIFYGAYWCPACAQQKTMFEGAVKKLPYVECSPDGRGTQTDECTEAEIDNYPVWEFDRDGGKYRCGGVTSPEVLAYTAGCSLPTYGDVENTPGALYERLVVTASRETLKKRGVAVGQIEEYIQSSTDAINVYLTEQYDGATVDTVANTEYILEAVGEVLHSCAPYEKQVIEVTESEGVEIELVPEEGADSAGDETESVSGEEVGGEEE